MQITLENIGIIKNSTLALDGLTVITGKNNSGKTTVGKTLYSLIDAVRDLKRNARMDRMDYILKRLQEIEDLLRAFTYIPVAEGDDDYLSDFPTLDMLLSGEYVTNISKSALEVFANDLEQDLKDVDSDAIAKLYGKNYLDTGRPAIRIFFTDQETYPSAVKSLFDERRNQALAILAQMSEYLYQDPDLTDYARERINQTLNVEFAGQIQPAKTPDVKSHIELSEDSMVFFQFDILDNHIFSEDGYVFADSPFRRAYLIDDPYIMDAPQARQPARLPTQGVETILDTSRIRTHNSRLRLMLRSKNTNNAFEQTVLDKSLISVKAQIDQVVPGAFQFSTGGDYYVEDSAKIRVSNLATGSKLFSILKILLEKGEIDRSTLLIFDEPEAHLHPQWQNAFVEVIVLLVKELGVNVLLTTHSSNFMLAVDAFMRKHKINDRTNFYQTQPIEGGFVKYECVNDDMGRIYQDFLQYLSEVKQLRDQFLYGGEEDE